MTFKVLLNPQGMPVAFGPNTEGYAPAVPEGFSVVIFDDAPVIETPDPPASERIASLERQHMLPKATRKFMLSFMEATAIQQGAGQGLTPEQSLAALEAGNPGYAAVKALDNQIEALEALL